MIGSLLIAVGCSGEIGPEPGIRLGDGGSGSAAGVPGTGGVGTTDSPECGDGIMDAGESCDPAETCPVACDDGNACTFDALLGDPATCDVSCEVTSIDTCANDDGCCPAACGAIDDNDCSPSCGNGTLESGETCDPEGSCPTSCDDQNACTTDLLTGSAVNCNVTCSHTDVALCANNDGCCPTGCSAANDTDCVAPPPMCGGAGPATTPLDAEEQDFLQLLNQHRAANGRGSVSACTALNRAAQGHSEDMRDQDYFDHTGLNGSSPIERACDACYLSCGSTGWGENIAAGNSDAQRTFNQWVNSPGHNANMLGTDFVVVGIGRATGGGTYGTYWTNLFGGQSDGSCNAQQP